MARPSAAASEALHLKILHTAAQAFLEHGFDDVSMDRIARDAKTSKQTIYARFPTKVALFAAVLAWRFQQRAAPRLLVAKEENLPPKQYLEKLGLILLRGNLDPEARQLFEMQRVALKHAPELAETFWNNGPGRGRAALREYLSEQVSRGVLVIPNMEIGIEHFLGLIVGGAIFRMSRGIPVLAEQERDLQGWVAGCVELFLSFYQAK